MKNLLNKLSLVIKDRVLRRRILFVVGSLIVFRVLATIPVPGVDALKLQAFLSGAAGDVFSLFNVFSGGGLSNLSIVMLGVSPFITASIVMQLLTMIFPKLKQIYQEEGEAGRAKFAQYSRLLTVPLSILQAGGFLLLLQKSGAIVHLTSFDLISNIIIVVAGSILLMWIGELMTEFGIGNGTSLIIFAGIVAHLPTAISRVFVTFTPAQIPLYLGFLVAAILIIWGVIVVTEAERPIPVTYAKRVRGSRVYGGVSTYLPLRLNQAGVIPIIFALSILLFPQMIFQFLSSTTSGTLQSVSTSILNFLKNDWFHSILYFVLVFIFTYFYTAVTFDPFSISENLQKNGAFIPGVRPGQSTSEYIAKVLTRITMVGALFLGLIAVLPVAFRGITGIQSLAIGGTALLIVVSVVIDLVKKIDAQVSMREY